MDTSNTEKKAKQPSKSTNSYATLRIKKDTRKRAVSDLKKVNEKKFGRKLRMDEYVAFALALVSDDHRRELQNSTLTHQDRLNSDYDAYVAEHGMISRDEYLGKRLSGEIPSPSSSTNGNAQNG